MDTMKEVRHEGLTATQDKVLSILPIPSAILSIFGSSVILYMAISTRRKRQWTTYIRLLVGLSICDIISSDSLALAAFLRRPESGRIWAFGNDASCTAIGTLIQFSYSNMFYSAMLSYYFMTSVRIKMKHSKIAKYLEPWMHLVSVGYPLVTSLVGASYGMYGEKATGMGCWVNQYPHGCGVEPGQEPCASILIGYLYLGLPVLFSGLSIIFNNLIIGCYVWAHQRPIRSSSRSRTTNSSSSASLDECATNIMDHVAHHKSQGMNKHQLRRLRLVSSQAFLFVACYLICNVWLGTLGIAEAMTPNENEEQLMQNMYGIMVINSIFAPLQGFLNMLVYIRPKYLKSRQDFPLETKLWATRRAIFGEQVRAHRFFIQKKANNTDKKVDEQQSVEPTKACGGSPYELDFCIVMDDIDSKHSHHLDSPQTPEGFSSIKLSPWDEFDQDSNNRGSQDLLRQSERWFDGAIIGQVSDSLPPKRRQSLLQVKMQSSISSLGRSSLPFISEDDLAELDVGSMHTFSIDDKSINDDCNNKADVGVNLSSEARWGSTTPDMGKASRRSDGFYSSTHTSSSPLVAPIRVPSENDEVEAARIWALSLGFRLSTSSDPNDSPLVIPQRLPSDCDTVVDTTTKKPQANDHP